VGAAELGRPSRDSDVSRFGMVHGFWLFLRPATGPCNSRDPHMLDVAQVYSKHGRSRAKRAKISYWPSVSHAGLPYYLARCRAARTDGGTELFSSSAWLAHTALETSE